MAQRRMISRNLGSSRKFHAVNARCGKLGDFAQALFPLIVVNADDFYGAEAYRAVAGFLRDPATAGAASPSLWAVVGYPLRDTLSAAGGVNRSAAFGTSSASLTCVTVISAVAVMPGCNSRSLLSTVSTV